MALPGSLGAPLLRPATPADAEAIAPWLRDASGPFIGHVFGLGDGEARALGFLRDAVRSSAGPFSHRRCTVAEVAGTPRGVALAYAAREKGRLERALFGVLWRAYGLVDLARVVRRGLAVAPLFGGLPADAWFLSALAVDPAARGLGLGTTLLAHVLAEGRARRRPTCALHVACDNPRAQALYERLGFVTAGEFHAPALEARFGLSGQRLMLRSLDAAPR